MNLSNYGLKGLKEDQSLKKSFIMQPYLSQTMHPQQNRNSLLKRSSFTLNQTQYNNPPVDYPKTPKGNMGYRIQNQPNSNNSYFHQSNYVSVPCPPTHMPLQQISSNRIQAFSLEEKKGKQPFTEQIIKQMAFKLQRTMQQVEKHQNFIKSIENVHGFQNMHNQSLAKIIIETVNDQMKVKQIQTNMHYNIIKNQVQTIRNQLNKFMVKSEVEDRIKNVGENISKAIQSISKDLMAQLAQMSENQTKSRKKQIEKIKINLEQQVMSLERNFDQRIKKQKDQSDKLTECSSMDTIPSRRIFLGDPLLVKISNKVSITLKGLHKQIQETEHIYKIDHEGYLLDGEGRYILNSKYQQVKLSSEQIQMIRANGFLK